MTEPLEDVPLVVLKAELQRRQVSPVDRLEPEECPEEWKTGDDAEEASL